MKQEQRWSAINTQSRRASQNGEGEAEQPGAGAEGGVPDPQAANSYQNEPMSVHITPLWVCFFVVAMCTMLLMLYFFFNQLGNRSLLLTLRRKKFSSDALILEVLPSPVLVFRLYRRTFYLYLIIMQTHFADG